MNYSFKQKQFRSKIYNKKIKPRRRSPRNIKFFKFLAKTLLIPLLITLLVLIINQTKLLEIRSVKIEPEYISCTSATEIKEHLNILGKNLILVDLDNIKEDLVKQFPCLKDASLSKNIAGELFLSLTDEKAAAVLEVTNYSEVLKIFNSFESTDSAQVASPSAVINVVSQKYLVTENGFLFSKFFGQSDLPMIKYINKDAKIGSTIENNALQESLSIVKKLQYLNLDYSEVIIYRNSFIVINEQKKGSPYISLLVFDLNEDYAKQLVALEFIIQKAKIDNKSFEKVDLRFDKPVVVYSSAKK